MFKEVSKDMGTLRQEVPVKISFAYEGDFSITNIHVTCGCTQATWNKEGKSVDITFTPNKVPYHFINQKRLSYNTDKDVLVETDRLGTIGLNFKALIVQ